MTNPVPFELRVANTNPHSKFSRFEIVAVIEYEHPRTHETRVETVSSLEELEEHPYEHSEPFYILYGMYADYIHPVYGAGREIRRFPDLKDAKELLVELNGQIEEDEDQE